VEQKLSDERPTAIVGQEENTTEYNQRLRRPNMYLGTMNGWKEQPKEYTKHLAECGTDKQVTIAYMEPNPNGVGLVCKKRQETRRYYDTTVKKVGTYSVKRTETCNECGCSWTSYS
tara:strand:- start:10 stop:357 length:348 start_codon:yes stop_codon:yes gene_type:complete